MIKVLLCWQLLTAKKDVYLRTCCSYRVSFGGAAVLSCFARASCDDWAKRTFFSVTLTEVPLSIVKLETLSPGAFVTVMNFLFAICGRFGVVSLAGLMVLS